MDGAGRGALAAPIAIIQDLRRKRAANRQDQDLIGDSTKISVAVAVEPSFAFEIFTADIDRWWRRGIKFRHAGSRSGLLCMEPNVGGRLFESFERDGTSHVVEVGQVRVWEPPTRLIFSWRNAAFAVHEHTEVQVEFAPT